MIKNVRQMFWCILAAYYWLVCDWISYFPSLCVSLSLFVWLWSFANSYFIESAASSQNTTGTMEAHAASQMVSCVFNCICYGNISLMTCFSDIYKNFFFLSYEIKKWNGYNEAASLVNRSENWNFLGTTYIIEWTGYTSGRFEWSAQNR